MRAARRAGQLEHRRIAGAAGEARLGCTQHALRRDAGPGDDRLGLMHRSEDPTPAESVTASAAVEKASARTASANEFARHHFTPAARRMNGTNTSAANSCCAPVALAPEHDHHHAGDEERQQAIDDHQARRGVDHETLRAP